MSLEGKRIDSIVDEYSNIAARDFVMALNLVCYKYAAYEYDLTHPDITHDASLAWKRIIDKLRTEISEPQEYMIVDIGSGTGFVVKQFLEYKLGFYRYVGLEPSSDMIKLAEKQNIGQKISFERLDISKIDEPGHILKTIKTNKIITLNSVLHHIVWWEDFLENIKNSLNPGDILVFCHEPNNRFWKNEVLTKNFDRIAEKRMRSERLKFFLNPINYCKKIFRIFGLGGCAPPSKYMLMNKELKDIGVIKKTMPSQVINAIIDYGVPLCWKNIPFDKSYDEGFFDVDHLIEKYFKGLEIFIFFTYQYLGISTKDLSSKWKKKEQLLEGMYPRDGAQFCLGIKKN